MCIQDLLILSIENLNWTPERADARIPRMKFGAADGTNVCLLQVSMRSSRQGKVSRIDAWSYEHSTDSFLQSSRAALQCDDERAAA